MMTNGSGGTNAVCVAIPRRCAVRAQLGVSVRGAADGPTSENGDAAAWNGLFDANHHEDALAVYETRWL